MIVVYRWFSRDVTTAKRVLDEVVKLGLVRFAEFSYQDGSLNVTRLSRVVRVTPLDAPTGGPDDSKGALDFALTRGTPENVALAWEALIAVQTVEPGFVWLSTYSAEFLERFGAVSTAIIPELGAGVLAGPEVIDAMVEAAG